jgi:hypothetical protein
VGLRWRDSVPAHNKGFKDGNSSAATASSLWASEGGTLDSVPAPANTGQFKEGKQNESFTV